MGFSPASIYRSYTPQQRKDIGLYILGSLCYKLGLEFFNGSITALAADRFNSRNTFTKIGAASGLNLAAQCVGAIMIAPLIKKFRTRTVLACAVLFFAVMATLLMIVDAATGGSIKPNAAAKASYGNWNPDVIFVIWTFAGISYGMVELIRRVIPCDIVGGNESKLRRMDAMIHTLYEVAGTTGAFASSAALQRFGNNYSFLFTPIFFTMAGTIWFYVSSNNTGSSRMAIDPATGEFIPGSIVPVVEAKKRNIFMAIVHAFYLFGESIYFGAKIVFGHRQFIWLIPAYSYARFFHQFLESTIAPAFARRVLLNSSYSQILGGMSNIGELLGALTVFFLSDVVTTPLPWLRMDALNLNIIWGYIPIARMAVPGSSRWAWIVGSLNIPISWGWAAGDVSLIAYIQARVSTMAFDGHEDLSALGSVMAILYVATILLNAMIATLLGRVIDRDFVANGNIFKALEQVGGIHFTVGCIIIFASTFIPIGAFAINPKMLGNVTSLGHLSDPESAHTSSYEEEKPSEDAASPTEKNTNVIV